MGRQLTHEEYVQQIYEKYGDEYTVIGKYTKSKNPITIRHNKCSHESGFFIFDACTAQDFKYGHTHCPYCSHSIRYGENGFIERLNKYNPHLIYLNGYENSSSRVNIKCKNCNGVFTPISGTIASKSVKCPYCTNHKVLKGFNDLWTTHPNVAKYLLNKEDGYKYTFGTGKNLLWKCPDCGEIVTKTPYIILSQYGKFKCPKCGDGVSYPEKFFYNVLSQLDINFTFQLSIKTFKWCGKYRYDFFLNDYNTIIEINGIQHYEENGWNHNKIVKNDKEKYDLAMKYIDKYIYIDASISDFNFIKDSIINSEFGNMFDLSEINWEKCGEFASDSLLRAVCKEWINGVTTTKEISEKFPSLSYSSIWNYLRKGSELGLCVYDVEELNKIYNKNSRERTRKPVQCVETGIIYETRLSLKNELGITDVHNVVDNPNKTRKGLHFISVEKIIA